MSITQLGADNADAEDLPTLHAHVALPLRFRRWSGWPRGKGHCERQQRLLIRSDDDERVGFVLDDQHLYLNAGWEPVRHQIVDALRSVGVVLEALPVDVMRGLATDPWLNAWPYDDEVSIYDDGPSSERGHDLIGLYFRHTGELDVLDERHRESVERLLQRMNVTRLGERCPVFAGSKDRRTMARIHAEVLTLNAAADEAERLQLLRDVDQLVHDRLATLRGDERPSNPALKLPAENWPGWSDACRFPVVRALPAELRPRVARWLRIVHHANHLRQAQDECRKAELGIVHPLPADRGWWPASDARRGAYLSERDVRRLEVALPWPDDVDTWIDALIERHNAFFAVVAGFRARHRYPQLWAAAETAWENRGKPESWFGISLAGDVDSQIAGFLAGVLWRRTVQRRTWEDADLVPCSICGEDFALRYCPYDLVVAWGADRWCPACRSAQYKNFGYFGDDDEPDPEVWGQLPNLTEVVALEAIRYMASIQQHPRLQVPKTPQAEDMPPALADAWLLARIALPNQYELSELRDGRTWTAWLQEAGVIGPMARLSRGTAVTAQDGHPCRSLLELVVDDFLSANNISHKLEPVYPWHHTLNPTGTRRGDWLLPGRVVVEAAGMNSEAYLNMLAQKRALAELAGFRLVTVLPAQLDDLASLFQAHLPQGPLAGAEVEEAFPSAIG